MSMTTSSKSIHAEINVTPLIDILLVLLIVFMVIVPSAVHGLDTLIPQPPRTPDRPDTDQPIVVQVFGDNQVGVTYKINEMPLAHSAVAPKLAEIFATRSEKAMFIKGDPGLDFSLVAEVIDIGRHVGAKDIGIITPHTSRAQ